jgi:uncharacterized protein (DUF58 family)
LPAARLFLFVSLLTLLLVAGLVEERLSWVALGLDGLLLAAFLLDLRRARRTRVSAERQWPILLVQGAPAEVVVGVTVAATVGGADEGRRFARRRAAAAASGSGGSRVIVLLREGLSPALAEAPLRHRLEVARGGRARWTLRLVPRRRGEAVVAPLTARVLGPWKLAWSQRDVLPAEGRRVYPQVRWEGRVGQLLALAQRHQLGSLPLLALGAGSEPYALREYLPGDPPSRLHWKATARHGRLITREETWERGARLLILLDAARTMTSREGDRSKLDYALAAALALTRVAAARGDRVTVLAFSSKVERVVRVGGGARGVAQAYGALFDLEARLAEPAYDLAAREAFDLEGRSATVVLFTSVVDLAAAELLRAALLSLERRHRPLLVNLQDPELEALASRPPADAPEAFAQVAALEILLANRRLGRTLRRAGIRVVATPADRLALETLEAYLALFRQRLGRRRAPVAPAARTVSAAPLVAPVVARRHIQ